MKADSLVTILVLVGISIISSILKKKGIIVDEDEHPKAPPLPRPPQPPFRRPPSPARRTSQKPASAPSPPPLIFAPGEMEEGPAQFRPLAPLVESSSRYEAAAKLPERTSSGLKRIAEQTEAALLAAKKVRRSPPAATILLRRPGGIREAMIASFILGRPKALEQNPS